MKYDYNEISRIYDDVRAADFEVVKFMVKEAQITENSRILEIGCGTANYLKLMKELTDAEVWGVDKSTGMLNKAKEKCEKGKFVEDDAVELSKVPDESFDLVYMVDVIHHIKDIEKMFKSIKRVLKKNGNILVFSDNHEHIKNRLTTKYFPETLEAELGRYQDTEELVQSLAKNTFSKIEHGIVEIGEDTDYGNMLIEIASKKGYSMFGLISEEAIEKGIDRIKKDMHNNSIVYKQRAPYVSAVK